MYKKILLIMRLTTVILIASLLQVSASTLAQNVTLKRDGASLKTLFSDIKRQTGFMLLYPAAQVNKSKRVTVDLKNVPLEEAMTAILKGKDLVFFIQDKTIIIKKIERPSLLDNLTARFQAIDVRGRVVDEKGSPLVGASVSIKSGNGTTTDKYGNFSLKNIDEKAVLVISFIGYLTKEINATADLNMIALEVANSKLDEVQVIAYGTTSKRFTTSNIGTISAADIEKQPVSNPLLALQGRVPGLFITQLGGASMSETSVQIQGRNSLQIGSKPFYVIDGVPYNSEFIGSTLAGPSISGQDGNAFNYINPADIESVTILKDADATSIYGSRAANGAILITTKKGKAGKTKVDVNIQNGWGKITRKSNLLNTQQYLAMRKEAYINAGQPVPTSLTAPNSSNYDLTVWDQNRFTDWQDVLVGGSAQYQNLQASISGGSENTQFLVGYGFNRQTTVYPNHLADLKANIHFNLNHTSDNKKFKYLVNGTYLKAKNLNNNTDLMDYASKLAPNSPALYNADGSLNFEPLVSNPSRYTFDNPLSQTLERYIGRTSNLIANNTMSYEVLTGLQLKASAGYNLLQANETKYHPISAQRPDAEDPRGSANYLTKSIGSWILEPQLTYFKETDFGVFDILLGSSFQQTKTDRLSQTASGFTSDDQLDNILAAPTSSTTGVVKLLYKYNAVFGRLNYRLDDKYILNFSARRDGSSKFGDQNKFSTFYAVGGAWLFGEERLIKTSMPWLSSGKLRGSYGTTGNDQMDDYQYLSLLDNYYTEIPYQGAVGLYPTNISNQSLQWEKTNKLNIGLDLGFLDNRLLISGNYFQNRSSNQLIFYVLPSNTGFLYILRNFPATVQNTGMEIQMDATPIKGQDFTWQVSINLTLPRNKLIAFENLKDGPYASEYTVGQPINRFKAYKYAGVNPTTGLYEFINSKGEKTSQPDASTDRTEIIDLNPKYYGGFSNTLKYKNLNLDFLFQYVNQIAQNNRFGNLPGADPINQTTTILDRWKTDGDIASVQKSSVDGSSFTPFYAAQVSDAAYGGSSYVRLKNVSLSYSLTSLWLTKARINSARIFLQGQNLLTFTNYIGNDPESKSFGGTPPLKMFTVGVQISL